MLIDARLRYESQEQRISWHVRIDPKTGSFKFPHYPPTDHTRAYPRLFQYWYDEQEMRKDLRGDDELSRYRVGWYIEEEQEMVEIIPEHGLAQGRPAYVFYEVDPPDSDVGRDIAIDREGRVAVIDR